MARIQELLEGRDERIDYGGIIKKFPWIIEKNQNCILSPDSDGLLCGLFMSHFLGWQIKGFYDGKIMVLENGTSANNCIFLDVEIFRNNIRSVGHHMLLYNKNDIPENWDNFDNCIQPNNLRNYDGYKYFRLKYPLATIHLLMGIIGSHIQVEVPESAIRPLIFTDGVYKNLFSYPENILNWLTYLGADDEESCLHSIFGNNIYSVIALMQVMDEFFRERDEITIKKERGDRLRLSDRDGSSYNIRSTARAYRIDRNAVGRIEQFIGILSRLTEWDYKQEIWTWTNLKLYTFTKRDFKGDGLRVNNRTYQNLIRKTPLSWAMSSNTNIEYTLEEPDMMSGD